MLLIFRPLKDTAKFNSRYAAKDVTKIDDCYAAKDVIKMVTATRPKM
jgi:hypothetical protein